MGSAVERHMHSHTLTLTLCKREGSGDTHTHTETHKSFSQRGAKSIPNTPHRFYLHGFDVGPRLSGEANLSLPSVMLGHTHAHAHKQMLTNDANTQNTRGTCAHTHETQAIICLWFDSPAFIPHRHYKAERSKLKLPMSQVRKASQSNHGCTFHPCGALREICECVQTWQRPPQSQAPTL